MNESDLIGLGIGCITLITVVALYYGIDGGVIATATAIISGAITYKYAQKKAETED